MEEEQKITWHNWVKNSLFIVFIFCVVIFPQTVVLGYKGSVENILFSIAIFLVGTLCLIIAAFWHRRDIHITRLGFWGGAIILMLSPLVIWELGLFVWPNIFISAYFLGKPAVAHFREKRKNK